MLESVTECYRVLQSITENSRVLQNIKEYYRVFLAHLLGPISGLVSFTIDLLVSGGQGQWSYYWMRSKVNQPLIKILELPNNNAMRLNKVDRLIK